MSKKLKNTFVDIELETGETVRGTLAYYWLLALKNSRKDVYDAYNRIMVNGPKEELENVTLLYAAYLCAILADNGDIKDAKTEEEFMSELSPDREYASDLLTQLVRPKKAKASAKHS